MVTSFIRRHWLILTLVGVAALLRLLVMIAYPPAFWYDGDSGDYIGMSWDPVPSRLRGLGYPAALFIVRHVGSLGVVVALQHLAGLLIAVGAYAFLRHRGLGAGLASLAAVPVLFDSLQIDLEHFILTETLFTTLLIAAVGALVWSDRPPVLACAMAGALVAGAWLTRPVAAGVAILLGLYLLLRRVGWRRIVAFAAAFVLPYLLVVAWVDGRPNVYTTESIGLITFGRAAMIADCDRVDFTPEQRAMCPDTPRDQRFDRADAYTWNYLNREQIYDPAYDPVLRGFSEKVIAAQPGDYAFSIVREILPYFLPWQDLGPQHRALAESWVLPASVRDDHNAPYLAWTGLPDRTGEPDGCTGSDPADPSAALVRRAHPHTGTAEHGRVDPRDHRALPPPPRRAGGQRPGRRALRRRRGGTHGRPGGLRHVRGPVRVARPTAVGGGCGARVSRPTQRTSRPAGRRTGTAAGRR
jgi:hypothetical protein